MRKLLMLGSLVALLVPAASHAQFQVGARVGFAPSMGDAAKDSAMKDYAVKSQIPLQLEASYKVTKDIAVGGYFSYGFGQTDNALFQEMLESDERICGSDFGDGKVDCSGRVLRFGVQGLYTFNQVKSPVVPWAGLSLGYEMAKAQAEDNSGKLTLDLSGFELGLQAGGDYRVNELFTVGPYVQLNIGQYRNAKFEDSGDPTNNSDESISDKALHQSFSFGIRGTFDL